MLWIDKHQPKTFEQLICHEQITTLLKKLASQENIPHLIFYGKSGAGKKTRILTLLQAIFGDKIFRIKIDTIQPEGTSIEFVCCSSLYHNQISASLLGSKDRICVQHLIKQLAAQTPATYFATQNTKKFFYRVFVIQDADYLSIEAQAGLRRTLEKYAKNARVILHCQQLSSIINPLKSRCLAIRVPLPTEQEITQVLKTVSAAEGLQIEQHDLTKIIESSERNIRRAIILLEVFAMKRLPASLDYSLPWKTQCRTISSLITKDAGVTQLGTCREQFYEMLTSLIPGQLILETVLMFLIENATAAKENNKLIHNYIVAAAYYSYTMKAGSKEIWHLEAFTAQCMNFYKQFGKV